MKKKQLSIECAFADFAYAYCGTADKNLQLSIIGDNLLTFVNGFECVEITAEQLEKLYNLPAVKITPDPDGEDSHGHTEIEINADGQLYWGLCIDIKELLNGIINYIYCR